MEAAITVGVIVVTVAATAPEVGEKITAALAVEAINQGELADCEALRKFFLIGAKRPEGLFHFAV